MKNGFSSRLWISLGLGLLTLPGAAAAEAPKPNFVVILIDDMGYADVGCYGSKLNRTPAIDRMAQEGMKLTSFYAAPVCSPSRAELMTGCYPKRVSLPNVLFPKEAIGLNPKERTVADLLKERGYATMAIGKWHLGDQPEFLPTAHGFDHFLGLPYSHDMAGGGKNNNPPLPLLQDARVIEAPVNVDLITARYTDAAVKFITENKDHPFFLYFPHNAVHVPMHPGAKFAGKSPNGLYSDWVEEVDWSVGRVLDTLRTLKLDSNTLVLFTSDNGPNVSHSPGAGGYATPLRGSKGSTYEGGMREPTIAWWPGRIAPGTTSDAPTAEMDVLPTLVRLAGGVVPVRPVIDGKDLWPLLSGQSAQSPHEALFYFNGNRLEAVRSGPWKLAVKPQLEGLRAENRAAFRAAKGQPFIPALYDLDTDISERTDVAAQHPDVVKRLQEYIATMDNDLGPDRPGPGVRPPGRVDNPKPLEKIASEYD